MTVFFLAKGGLLVHHSGTQRPTKGYPSKLRRLVVVSILGVSVYWALLFEAGLAGRIYRNEKSEREDFLELLNNCDRSPICVADGDFMETFFENVIGDE